MTSNRDQEVTVTLSADEALVLFDWLARTSEAGAPVPFVDQAEQRVLGDVLCLLERVLVVPFRAVAHQELPPRPGRPWSLPLPVTVLLVLIHLRTNLTTRALAALSHTSQSTADRTIHHLVPVLAKALRPAPDASAHPWIIDATPIPVHDQSITAISKNYRRSINTQIIICAHRRRVMIAGSAGPETATTSSSPGQQTHTCSPDNARSSLTAATAASTRSPHQHQTSPPGSSATITTAHTGAPRPRRACHRQDQGLADPSTMPPTRRRHQPQPSDRCWSLEPEGIQPITGQRLGGRHRNTTPGHTATHRAGSDWEELRMKRAGGPALRLLCCAAAATVAVLSSAGMAHADEDGYLNQLSRHGYQVVPQSREFLLGSGHAMCNELQAGHSPEDVAKHWTYPNASYQNLVDMANAAQDNLCPGRAAR